ncbi:Non-specific serine/threonine protein kinase [Aquirufa nivalisilvae]|uniref:Non-specific serine/threonine protein kinase n=6 Tax=Aquirufa nivalisilvae TaxID=2516557 RepID=A0A2S2DVS3_9BACT|nr:gliding motility-associated C-terminal domain-containing protein [Aquirufa nivalisilvae]AWL09160.1 Non-specific serine/threonine protein kinase [Aquirufa nivalisilvae]
MLQKSVRTLSILCFVLTSSFFSAFAQFPLDLLNLTASSPASVAFSVRKLSTSYTGKIIQVRRASDNAIVDIGFDSNNELSASSICTVVSAGSSGLSIGATLTFASFYAGTDVFVSKWYDQSGNGNDLSQASSTNQPQLVSAGSIILERNKPFIRFSGTISGTDYRSLALSSAVSTNAQVIVVNKFQSSGNGFLLGDATNNNWNSGSSTNLLFSSTLASSSIRSGTIYQNGLNISIASAVWNTSLGINSVEAQTANSGTSWDNIGRDRLNEHTTGGGGWSELISFPATLSMADRIKVELTENTYFGIPIIEVNSTGFSTCSEKFTVTGKGLSANIVVTAPTGYTVSTSLSGTYTASVTLTQSSGVVNETTIYVKQTTGGAGNVVISSTGFISQNLAIVNALPNAPTQSVGTVSNNLQFSYNSSNSSKGLIFNPLNSYLYAPKVSDAPVIQIYSTSGTLISASGSLPLGGLSNSAISSLNVDNLGNVYIIMPQANGIVKMEYSTNTMSVFASITSPQGSAVDSNNNLYVTTTGNVIYKITPSGVVSTFCSDSQINNAFGLCFDPDGNMYVANRGAANILKINPSGTSVSVYATSVNTNITDLIRDSNGNLFYGIFASSIIRKVATDRTITTYANSINAPQGMTFDAQGAIYVAANATTTKSIYKLTPPSPNSICGSGTMNLSISATSGIVGDWYTSSSGGTAAFTGTNTITTPSTSIPLIYYVESRNSTSGCVSNTRTKIVAPVNGLESITAGSACETTSATLSAIGTTGTVNWFDGTTGASVYSSGASFTTPVLSSTTTFYAQAALTGCPESSRTAVVATAIPRPTVTLSSIASVYRSATSFLIPYTASTNSPDQYTLTTGTTALSGFTALTNSSLVSSPISVGIPVNSALNTYNFNFSVRNSGTGCVSPTSTFNLVVNDIPPSGFSYSSPATFYRGESVTSISPTVTGSNITYSVSPILPVGLTLDVNTGIISGTPSSIVSSATYVVTATNSGGSTSFNLSLEVVQGAAIKFIITGTGTQTAGASQNITITAVDVLGQAVTAFTGTKNLTFSGASSSASPVTAPKVGITDFGTSTSVSFTNGVATPALTLYKVETAVIVATQGTITTTGSDRLTVIVSPSGMSKFLVSLMGPQTSGTAFSGTNSLTAQDAYGNVVTGFDASTNNVTVSSSLTGSITGLSGTNKLNSASDFVSGVANLTSLGLKYTGESGSGTFTFTPATGAPVSSSSLTINSGTATKLIITGTGTQTAGTSQTITITAKDASGNTATAYTGVKSITFSGASASSSPVTNPTVGGTNVGTATNVTFSNGVATASLSLYHVESAVLAATDGSLSAAGSDRLSVSVSAGSFSKLIVSLTSPQTSGTAFSGTNSLIAQDAYGNVVTGFDASTNNITVSTSLTGSISGLSGTNKLNNAGDFVSGVANISSLTFTGTSGTGTFTFTPASGTAVTSGSVSIGAGSATKFIVTGTGTQTAGGSQNITITAKDASGNTATAYTGAKSITFSGANASSSPATNPTVASTDFGTATSVSFTNGVATVSMSLYKVESALIVATDGSVTTSGSDRLSVSVSPAVFSKLALSLAGPQINGVAFTGTNSLTALDAYGNVVTGFDASTNNITVSTSLSGSISGLSGTTKLSNAGDFVSGVANLSSLGLKYTGAVGSGTFTFTPASGTAVTSGSITINPGSANKFVITGSGTQTAGTSQTITITAKDANGNTVSSYSGSKDLTFSGANSSASPTTAPKVGSTDFGTATSVSFTNGVATASMSLYKVESASISVTDGSLTSSGGGELSVSVSVGTFAKFSLALAGPQTSGTAFSGTNSLTAQDAYGNVVTGFDASTNNVTVSSSLTGSITGLSGTNKLNSASDFVSGVANLTSLGLKYTGESGSGTFTFTPATGAPVSSSSLTINSGTATKLIITGTGTQTAGTSQTITITAKDASGNTATAYTGVKSITFSGASASSSPVTNPTVGGTNVGTATNVTFSNGVATASLSLYQVESAVLAATDGSLSAAGSDRLSVSVSAGSFSKLIVSLTSPQTSGTAFSGTNSLIAQDAYGNVVTGFDASTNNITVSTSLTGSISGLSGTNKLNNAGDFVSGVANISSLTFTGTSGTGTFTFTPASGTAVTSGSVSIGAGSATKFIVTGTGTQTAGGSQNITITAKDASGNTATAYTGAKSITFSGANASSSPATNPTVASTDFGTATSVSFTNGVATVSMSLYKVESALIVATDGSVTTSGSDRLSVSVSPAVFSKLALSLAGPQINGVAFTGTNSLTALDAYGNVVTGFDASTNNITVSTSLSGSISGLSGTNKLNSASDFVSGVANLSSLGLKYTGAVGSGTFTFTPASGTVVTSSAINFNSGVASRLSLSTISSFSAGTSQTVTVSLVDASGNLVNSNENGRITLSVKSGSGTILGTVTADLLTGQNAVTFTNWSYNKSESGVIITALASSLNTSNLNGKVGDSNSFIVSPGNPYKYYVTSTQSITRAGSPITVKVIAKDEFGNICTNLSSAQLIQFWGANKAPNGVDIPQAGLPSISPLSLVVFNSKDKSTKKISNSITTDLDISTSKSNATSTQFSLVQSGMNAFGSSFSVNFVNGEANVQLILVNAELALLQAINSSGTPSNNIADKFSLNVTAADFSTFKYDLDPKQDAGKLISGFMTAIDTYGNTIIDFNAALNPVTIVVKLIVGGIIKDQKTVVLNRSTDYVNGVANFSVLGNLFPNAISGSIQIAITPSVGISVQTAEIVMVASDSDGDSVTDEQELIDKTDVNDGCSYLMSSFVLSKTSSAWKAMDCDGDGSPNGTDVEPSNACSGGVAGYIPPRGSVGYAKYFAGDCDSDGISNEMECNGGYLGTGSCQDFDSDGIPNFLDPDSDNDGILDMIEKNIDSDGDGHANYLDLDSDNDGILDSQERSYDTDGDGVMNFLDIDSDNDGILDAWEGTDNKRGTIDDNYDGRVDKNGSAPDVNGNGLADFLEGNPAPVPDTDKDGTPDYIDLDSDGDGIADKIELTNDPDKDGKPNYRDKDSDGDWLGDSDERDTDNDGDRIPNYLDADSDGDGIPDAWEGKDKCRECDNSNDDNDNGWDDRGEYKAVIDTDKDGSPDFLDLDSDNDCIPDGVEGGADWDQDKLANFRDTDSDGDGILDIVEVGDCNKPWDTDGDGLKNFEDTDSDGDGIPDAIEAGKDLSKPVDTDGDGIPDMLDLDSDNDTIPDKVEVGSDVWKPLDTDKDGKDDFRDTDSDGDRILDVLEVGKRPFLLLDTDSDGIWDYLDVESDGDGILDSLEAGKYGESPLDSDQDGIYDFQDLDSDNDGMLDSIEAGADKTKPLNTDDDIQLDGLPKYDYRDTDSDNDGIPDFIEAGLTPLKPQDTDGDNIPDYRELDADNDGILDRIEAGKDPLIPVDTDKDGKADYTDFDSDNDTILDKMETSLDTDKDGLPDYIDLDSDGDLIPDQVEVGLDPVKPLDTDKDDVFDFRDLDSDGDGIPDKIEAGKNPNSPADTDGDGLPDYRDVDSDNNGIPDKDEVGPDPLHPLDTDKNGIPDYLDPDDDGDRIPDKLEEDLNYGALPDCDHDGIPNSKDKDVCEIFMTQGFSPNGDGVNDKFVIPGIMSMPSHHLTIFNRWGNIVYETDNYKNDWGGEISKQESFVAGDGRIADGVYFYFIDFKGSKPNVQSFIYVNHMK